jgi:GNAT superfamily N-acetyltransferase
MRGEFYSTMDIHSDETLHFATSIFTAQGNIRPELLKNAVQKGSGVWGSELNEGSLFLIETIRVTKEHRRKGLGHWLLAQTLKIPEVASNCKFVFAWPAVLNDDNDCADSECKTQSALILHFFHLAGFRRVGRTSFLGLLPPPPRLSYFVIPCLITLF